MNDELYRKADIEYENGNYTEAFNIFMKLALSGDDGAMDRIATMYLDGEGVEYCFEKGIGWYKKSVEAGGTTSLHNLGVTYRSKGDLAEAKYWFEKSVEAGNYDSALDLAKMCLIFSDKKDLAISYLEKCLEGGDYLFEDVKHEAEHLLSQLKA